MLRLPGRRHPHSSLPIEGKERLKNRRAFTLPCGGFVGVSPPTECPHGGTSYPKHGEEQCFNSPGSGRAPRKLNQGGGTGKRLEA